ncbi:MAG: tetratricopeptide repeat protein, partial [Cyclobacteriaceae bacterium]
SPSSIRWSYLYYNFCQVYAAIGNYDKAIDYAFRGLRISEQQKDERQTNIGFVELQDIYKQTGDDENWLKYIRKALVFARKTDNGMRTADLNYSLSLYYIDHHQLDSAEYYMNAGLDFYKENNMVEGLGRGYLMKGHIHYARKEFDLAIETYTTALESFSPSSIEISRAYQSLGESYVQKMDFESAEQYLSEALNMRLKSGEVSQISATYKALAENSRLSGAYKQAYAYLELFNIYQDSLFNENKAKQIAELGLQYETEKKDQAILALEKDREIQALLAGRRQNQIYLVLGGLAIVFLVAGFFYNRSRIRQRANKLLQEKNEKIALESEPC